MLEHEPPTPWRLKRKKKNILDAPSPGAIPPRESADLLGDSVLWFVVATILGALSFQAERSPLPLLAIVCALTGAISLSRGVKRYAAHADAAALRAWKAGRP